jgi:DNA-binding transcriptional MerR regulator
MDNVAEVTKLLDLEQLASAWRVSPHTIRAWVKQGRLKPERICRRLLFDPKECERFLQAGAPEPRDPEREREAVNA